MSNTAVRPPSTARLGAGGDGFDASVAGVAQMDVRIDQAGQHVQAGGVEHLVRGGVGRNAQCRDPPVAHADGSRLRTPWQDTGAVADQKVKMRRHWWSFPVRVFLPSYGQVGHAERQAAAA